MFFPKMLNVNFPVIKITDYKIQKLLFIYAAMEVKQGYRIKEENDLFFPIEAKLTLPIQYLIFLRYAFLILLSQWPK
jgi:hypothetical protein